MARFFGPPCGENNCSTPTFKAAPTTILERTRDGIDDRDLIASALAVVQDEPASPTQLACTGSAALSAELSAGGWKFWGPFYIEEPSDQNWVRLVDAPSDATLVVRRGGPPNTDLYDCQQAQISNNCETCPMNGSGFYWVGVNTINPGTVAIELQTTVTSVIAPTIERLRDTRDLNIGLDWLEFRITTDMDWIYDTRQRLALGIDAARNYAELSCGN